jgi:hypothetical protein
MRKSPSQKGNGKSILWLRDHVSHAGDDCLTWPFSDDGRGYGTVCYCGKNYKAHRMMCEIAHGAAPTPEHHAAHSCGNGHLKCVNPRHLSWKTPKENAADSVKHGTARFGSGRKRFTLTPEQVVEIRALKGTKTQDEIGAMFGVGGRQIGKIHRGVTWRDGSKSKGGFFTGDPNNPFKYRPRVNGHTV